MNKLPMLGGRRVDLSDRCWVVSEPLPTSRHQPGCRWKWHGKPLSPSGSPFLPRFSRLLKHQTSTDQQRKLHRHPRHVDVPGE